jgi:hypothetical protein
MDTRGEPAARAMSERVGAERVQQITDHLFTRFLRLQDCSRDPAWRPPAASAYRSLATS